MGRNESPKHINSSSVDVRSLLVQGVGQQSEDETGQKVTPTEFQGQIRPVIRAAVSL